MHATNRVVVSIAVAVSSVGITASWRKTLTRLAALGWRITTGIIHVGPTTYRTPRIEPVTARGSRRGQRPRST